MPANIKRRDPMKTKSGKIRLGPLNYTQLEEQLKNCRPKHKMKIQRRMTSLIKNGYVVKKNVGEDNAVEG